MHPRSHVAIGVTALFLMTSPSAQPLQTFGDWAGGRVLYVDGSAPPGGDGSLGSPFRTISGALNAASTLPGFPPGYPALSVPHTINIAPGTYREEVRIPAYGVSLEGWQGRPVIEVAQNGVQITTVGNASLPGSVLLNLNFEPVVGYFTTAITVRPGLDQVVATPQTVGVEIRSCSIVGCDKGIEVLTDRAGWKAFHVVENNRISGVWQQTGYAILDSVSNDGTSSSLIRGNDVSIFEQGIWIRGDGSGVEKQRARLFNNFVQQCESNVKLVGCSPIVRNNTIAYAVEHTFGQAPVGVDWDRGPGELDLRNNILWNPDTEFAQNQAVDYQASSGPVTPAQMPQPNINEDHGSTFPSFAGVFTAGYPGLGSFDLHLSPFSTAIDAGDNLYVAEIADPLRPYLYTDVPGGSCSDWVRLDTNVDIDQDPRIVSASSFSEVVDLGADEVSPYGIGLGNPSGPTPSWQDTLGHLWPTGTTPSGNVVYRVTVYASGPIGTASDPGAWAAFFGYGFYDQVTPVVSTFACGGPVTPPLPNGPLHQNLLGFGYGNFLYEADATLSGTALTGYLSPSGTAAATFSFPVSPSLLEGEMYVQFLFADPAAGVLTHSNRLRLEFDQR